MATTHIHHDPPKATPWLAFTVGVVLVGLIAAALAFFAGGGMDRPTKAPVNVEITTPQPSDINLPNAPRLPRG